MMAGSRSRRLRSVVQRMKSEGRSSVRAALLIDHAHAHLVQLHR